MADSIVQGLFGVSPYEAEQASNARLFQSADKYAQQALFERAAGQMYRAGGMLGGAGAEAAGMVNPQVQEAQQVQMIMSQIDPNTAEGLTKGALLANQMRNPKLAFLLSKAAQERKAQEADVAYKMHRANAENSPFAKVDPKDYTPESLKVYARTKDPTDLVARDKPQYENASTLEKLMNARDVLPPNDPRRASYDAAIRKESEWRPSSTVNVAAPVTPVTIQDPENPNATIIVDGRTGKKIGAGPKLTETGKGIQKQMTSMQGLGSDLQKAEDLLLGKGRDSEGNETKGVTPTGSGLGAAYDAAAGFVGVSPPGAAEADALKVVSGRLVQKVPRFEGPQSDKDVALYKEMAADVGDKTKPIARRIKAIQTMREIYSGYEDGSRGRLIQDNLLGAGTKNVSGKISSPPPPPGFKR